MDQQPDKLFRDKLRNYHQPVSPGAWDRISGSLHRKKSTLVLRIAAAVLLLATGTLLIYPSFNRPGEDFLSDESSSPAETPAIAPPERVQPQPPAREDVQPPSTTSPVAPTARKKRVVAKAGGEQLAAHSAEVPEDPHTTQTEITVTEENSVAVAPTATQQGKMTIIFSREEVNRKYLAKNLEGHATADAENPSGLTKLLDKAYDLKHTQDLLGSLRQKKNEILAINFRNDARSTQND